MNTIFKILCDFFERGRGEFNFQMVAASARTQAEARNRELGPGLLDVRLKLGYLGRRYPLAGVCISRKLGPGVELGLQPLQHGM